MTSTSTTYADNTSGAYRGTFVGEHESPRNAIAVPCAPGDARQTWNFEKSEWNPLPPVSEEEMRQSEIEQDKQYLADTDWIIAKMGEASFTGKDSSPLIEQYAEQLKERENARIRIRINEGRA